MDDQEVLISLHVDPDSGEWIDDLFDLKIGDIDEFTLTRDERDMFVALHKEAMERDECVFSFNQDSPKFRMTLSGDDEEIMHDVDLE